ncbi:XAA-PRO AMINOPEPTIDASE [Mycoplasmopsis pulmonis]|uniref:XAA-PRO AMINOPEPTIDASE n=1 Tax=Mycoplasmopsis pulmonis (strain UAB CTIP) TaxID=272635 RepID=Q98Q78_MYCPU|nr:aminopeptidase P family protein [Mycoplasmopsis pulmonis]MDZ7293502.1 aminopeptidase P family protein [Mycoplasmopsis pulmonis]CAC13661.1 XAA-PRO AMINOPEPTIDASE [Mycoplasmopsis pulmonis]VEU68255.1 Xaa-Pro aminopeptidase [Mycoplasmopsis pulmonis]
MDTKYLKKVLEQNQLEAIVSEAYQTRLWYSQIQSSDGYIVIEKDRASLFVDSRYIEYARKNAKNVDVILLTSDSLKDFFAQRNFKRLGFEKNYLTMAVLDNLKKLNPNAEFVGIDGQELRILKSKEEVDKLQKSIDISLKALDDLIKNHLKEGMSEKEVDWKLNYLLKKHGAEKESFSSIIASGPNSSMPHAHTSDRKIKEGELLTIDFGGYYKGYATDITRTFIFKENKSTNPKAKEILEIVEEAARLGREVVKPGILSSEVDKVCRDYIESKGYGQYFLHSTGHGLGIDVHELPNVSKFSNTVLEPGMVITVEPGIYIEGLGGARVEDDILVTEKGSVVLSRKNSK